MCRYPSVAIHHASPGGDKAPAPVVNSAHQKAMDQVVQRVPVDGMAAEGCAYQGILYAGLMVKQR